MPSLGQHQTRQSLTRRGIPVPFQPPPIVQRHLMAKEFFLFRRRPSSGWWIHNPIVVVVVVVAVVDPRGTFGHGHVRQRRRDGHSGRRHGYLCLWLLPHKCLYLCRSGARSRRSAFGILRLGRFDSAAFSQRRLFPVTAATQQRRILIEPFVETAGNITSTGTGGGQTGGFSLVLDIWVFLVWQIGWWRKTARNAASSTVFGGFSSLRHMHHRRCVSREIRQR